MPFASTDSSLVGRFRSFMRTFSFRVMLWMFIVSVVMTIFTTILSAVIVRRSIVVPGEFVNEQVNLGGQELGGRVAPAEFRQLVEISVIEITEHAV